MLATSCFSRNDVGVGLTSKVVDALPFGVITCARSFDSVGKYFPGQAKVL